ncbi:uncharacterized protein [Branchiostoma lanceolatum]|uniref:uncharacterized protein n=1 Tax=Branchiostoma lanceolatum TaxID=7740 RepID=UPI0034522F07
MREEILDLVDSITDLQQMGMEEDFCSMKSNLETDVANITASNPNCGPDDIPVILEYIADGKYDTVVAWAEDKCPVSTSDGGSTLPSATLVIALQLMAAVAVGRWRIELP